MDERIKKVRKSNGLNQIEFGNSIGVKAGTVACYETGARTPIDAIIQSICRVYGVNEVWLRTGEGEMLVQNAEADELMRFCSEIVHSGSEDFRAKMIYALSKLPLESWIALENFARSMLEDKNGTSD